MKRSKRLLSVLLLLITVMALCMSTQAAVKISRKKATLIKGQKITLTMKGTKKKVKWSSSKKKVAAVNKKGVVTAKAKGTAIIKAKVGKKTYKCTIKVETPKLSKTKAVIGVGDVLKLKLKGTSLKLKWTTGSKKIAVVKNGVVTGKKAGTTKITCSVKDYPKFKAVCTVTVRSKKGSTAGKDQKETEKEVEVSGISFDKTFLALSLGESALITAEISPENADAKKVEWKSSDETVASVKDGKVETAASGSATIKCQSVKDPTISAECLVMVINDDLEELDDHKFVMAKTGNALHQRRNGNRASSATNSNGQTVWSIGTTANGVVRNIKVYRGYEMAGCTSCNAWGNPVLTCAKEHDLDHTALKNGSYSFASDPSKILTAWGIWNSDTTKEEFEKMINGSISSEVFNRVKGTFSDSYLYSASGGGATVILYGKNANGKLIGKFAGVTSYNMTSNALYLRVIGINSENAECYGENYYEDVT